MPLLAAFGLGLLTAISPCPLATNIAAIAYVSKRVDSKRAALLSGALYTAGRAFSYILLGAGLVYLGANVVNISGFLRNAGTYTIGPFLILAALVMLDVLKLSFFKGGISSRLQQRFADGGLAGSFVLGTLFALAFCPYSAVLFFGMLIPLALDSAGGGIALPAAYALGTGLPVMVFAVALALGMAQIGKRLNDVQSFEKYLRKGVGMIFLGVGIYYLVQMIRALA
ncbi:MAG: cytochrome C biogenesis protein [Deltaproteobacteria bacterium HGW-Deltaproteobacteria-11]|nr:MAG: cytochrome C biogenesis protein [Deltaproteobacteria bacterium HGW-Deltaproteobacteria-11]